jgi:hypothetical protein
MPGLEVVHEAPDAARTFYRGDQGPDQERENQHAGVARIRKDVDRAVKAPDNACQRIELAYGPSRYLRKATG